MEEEGVEEEEARFEQMLLGADSPAVVDSGRDEG